MHITNAMIVPAAIQGKELSTRSGSFSTLRHVTSRGYLPTFYADLISRRNGYYSGNFVDQVIYSYDTPIAWRERDAIDIGQHVWVIPDITYSATTSTKHQSQLWKLPNAVRMPADVRTFSEYADLLMGHIEYRHGVMVKGSVER